MIFAEMQDSHDKRINDLLDKAGDKERDEAQLTNYNLVGIRRRLNNIEIGVWAIVLLLALNLYRGW